MLKKSRSYALTVAALAAVFVAISPVSAPPAFAQGAPAKAEKKSELELMADAAFKLASEKKYDAAIKAFNDLKNGKYKEVLVQNELVSLLDYQIAACLVAQKKWDEAETALKSFLEKYPDDPQIQDVRLSLINCSIQKEDWAAAREMLDRILKSHPPQGLFIKASIARVDLLEKEGAAKDKAGEKPPAGIESFEILALTTGAQNLQGLTNNTSWTPEMIEARQKLVGIYMKLGRKGEAKSLKAKIDAYLSGDRGAMNPAAQIRATMQDLEVGDERFEQAQLIDPDFATDEELAQQKELFRQALQIYQSVMRKSALMKCFDPATKSITSARDSLKKKVDEAAKTEKGVPERLQTALDKAEEALEELNGYKEALEGNKDFDALISFRIGASLLSLNRSWEAYVAFGDIIQNHKDFELLSTSTYYYILTLRAMGRDDEAQAECKKFLETFKNDKKKGDEVGRVALLLGQISFDRGDYKDTIAQLEWVKANTGRLPIDVSCQIDWFTISAYFARCPWGILNDEEKEYIKDMGKKGYKPKLSQECQKTLSLIDQFIEKYRGNRDFAPVVEEMQYRRALLFFYSTMLPETRSAFENYIDKYPEGLFIPDARYRLAVVQNGVRPPQTQDVVSRCTNWIKDYFQVDDKGVYDATSIPKVRTDISINISDSVVFQLPEVYTLLGDANKSLAEAVKGSDVRKGIGNKKIVKLTKSDELKRQKFMDASIDAYILAAKTARYNPDALYFSLMELDKQLPQLENGYARLLDLYDTLYNWDINAPEALNYLFKKIDYTVRKARSEAQKMEKAERQAHIDAAQEETRKIMAEAILKNIDNPRQDGVETLIGELAQRLAMKVKFHRVLKEGEIPPPRDPNEYTAEKAVAELTELLNLKDETNATLIARARGSYAKAIIYDLLATPRSADFAHYCDERDRTYRLIANSFEPNELSPAILSMVGTFLLDHKNEKRAEQYFQYVLDFYKGSETAEYSFAGMGKILLDRKDYKKAFEIFTEAIEGNVAYMLEADLRLGRAESLIKMTDADASALNISDRLENAMTELNYIKGVKEWRGRATAASLFYLGQIKESRRQYEAAVGDYRICYLTWKKYPEFAAKAMLRTGIILRDQLGQPEEAKLLFLQMTDPSGRYKNTPEAKEAESLLQTL